MPELKTVEENNFHPDIARDVKLQTHMDDSNNPHGLTDLHAKQHGLGDTSDHTQCTLAELNSLISDATLGSTSQYHVVYVSKDGNDTTGDGNVGNPYLTVKHALSSISDNDSTNRYSIKIGPGVYVENNPLALKAYVSIDGGDQFDTQLVASNTTSNLITGASGSSLNRIDLKGVTSGYAVSFSAAGCMVMRNCSVTGGQNGRLVNNAISSMDINKISMVSSGPSFNYGVHVTAGFLLINNYSISSQPTITCCVHASGSNSRVNLTQFFTDSNNITTAICVENSADVTVNGARITGDLGDRMGTAFRCTDAGSELDVLSTYIQHADYGVYVDGECDVDLSSVIIENCQYGLYSHTTGNEAIHIHGGAISASIDYDIYLTESTATLIGSGMAVDEDKLYLDNANVYMAHISTNDGDEGLGIKGELHVGSPESGSESVFGEGDSYIRGLLAYTYDGTTYTDISDDVKSYSGSTFTFPNLNVNSAIYLGSDLVVSNTADYHQSLGIKMSLVTSQSGGAIVAEYWDGSSWTEFNTMTAESGGSYYRKSDQLFSVGAGSYQVRYDPFIDEDWTKNNDPSYAGGNRYWVRFRITSTLSIAPIFEQFKLHSNRTELNNDGYNEMMGRARPYITVSVPWSTFQDSASKMGDKDLYLTDNCHTGFKKNKFDGDGDSIGTVFTIPNWVDTSAPMKVKVVLVPAYSGTLEMKVFLNSSLDGDSISTALPGSTIGEISSSISKTVVSGEQITYFFDLDISDKGIQYDDSDPETLWLNLESTDLDGGEIYGMVFDIGFLSWRTGQHV